MEARNNPPPPPVAAGDPTPSVITVSADGTVPSPPGVVVQRAAVGKNKGGKVGKKKGDGVRTRGHPLGARNYCKDILISIIDTRRPSGIEGWKLVATEYQQASKEPTLCAAQDIWDHWTKKLCNNYKKPTGKSGDITDQVHHCIRIDHEIGLQQDAGVLGASSAEDSSYYGDTSEVEDEEEEDDEENVEIVGIVGGTIGDVEDNEEEDDKLEEPVLMAAAPAPAARSLLAAASSFNSIASSSIFPLPGSSCPSSRASTSKCAPTPVVGKSNSGGSSSSGKTKNSTNCEQGSMAKSIEKMSDSMSTTFALLARSVGGGGDGEAMMPALSMLSMQMMQQWQMAQQAQQQQQQQFQFFHQSMQMQIATMQHQSEESLKYLKIIVKTTNKNNKKRKDVDSEGDNSSNGGQLLHSKEILDQCKFYTHQFFFFCPTPRKVDCTQKNFSIWSICKYIVDHCIAIIAVICVLHQMFISAFGCH